MQGGNPTGACQDQRLGTFAAKVTSCLAGLGIVCTPTVSFSPMPMSLGDSAKIRRLASSIRRINRLSSGDSNNPGETAAGGPAPGAGSVFGGIISRSCAARIGRPREFQTIASGGRVFKSGLLPLLTTICEQASPTTPLGSVIIRKHWGLIMTNSSKFVAVTETI